jgi:tRNA nucleotidyltransferase (CCA-adding enzyme)
MLGGRELPQAGPASLPAVDGVCQRLKVPAECRDLAIMAAREYRTILHAPAMPAEELVALLERNDALRKPQRLLELLQALLCLAVGAEGKAQVNRLELALAAARQVNAGEVAQRYMGQPQKIAEAVHQARVEAVANKV